LSLRATRPAPAALTDHSHSWFNALMLQMGGGSDAAGRLAEVPAGQEHIDEAIKLMQTRADAGDRYAAGRLAVLLSRHGRFEEAIATLRQLADDGDPLAPVWLIELPTERGSTPEREDEVAAGTPGAAERLANLRQPANTRGR
jgi:hypothetical protein